MKRLMILALALLLLAGCANAPEGAAGVPASAASTATASAAAAAVYDPTTDWPYGVEQTMWFENLVPVENGYYMILSNFLFYMDSPAMEPVPVCFKPNCLHYFEPDYTRLQACGAFLPVMQSLATLFYYDGKLYHIESVKTINDPEHPRQFALVRTDPDGANYEIAYRMDPECMPAPGLVHRGVFYFPLTAFDEADSKAVGLYALDLSAPGREAERLLEMHEFGGHYALPLMAYGDKLYFSRQMTEDAEWEFCIVDIKTKELQTLPAIDGLYDPEFMTFIGDRMYLTCHCTEPQGDPTEPSSYPQRLYRCGLDGSEPELLLEGWGEYASDQTYLYRVPSLEVFDTDPEDRYLQICDPDGRELDRVDLSALVEAERIRGAGLLIPPGDQALFFIMTRENELREYVYWFDKSEIGTGQITVHPLLHVSLGFSSDMRGTQIVELDTAGMREMMEKAAATGKAE